MITPTQRKRAIVAAILVALALLPLLTAAPRVARAMRGLAPASDFALLELSTDEAARGTQTLGPYSRFGWRHPGPAYFYLLAPFYVISGANSAALPVAALVINWAGLLGIMALLWRWADDATIWYLALPLALAAGLSLGPGFFYNVWNPAIGIVPLAAFLVLCAGLACARVAAVPMLAAVGSFLIQTHIGYLPCVVVAALTAVGFWLRGRRAAAALETRRFARQVTIIVVTVAILIALWALPVAQQLSGHPGNLSSILQFFTRPADRHGLAESLVLVAREIAWLWSYLMLGPRRWYDAYPPLTGWRLAVAAGLALAQTTLLAVWCAHLRDRRFCRALAAVCLASTVVAVPAVMRISGEVRPYLIAWISVVGVLGSLAAVAPLITWARVPVPPTSAPVALLVPAGLTLAVALIGGSVVRDSEFPAARSISDALIERLHQSGVRRPHAVIQPQSPELFFAASAVLLQIHKAGVPFSVDRNWWNFFGDQRRPTGAEDGELQFRNSETMPMPPSSICSANGKGQMCISLTRRSTPP